MLEAEYILINKIKYILLLILLILLNSIDRNRAGWRQVIQLTVDSTMKVHVLRDLKAYYVSKGRKWVVETKVKKEVYDSFESMIEAHPQLMELEVMQVAKERRSREKYRPIRVEKKAPVLQRPVDKRTEKIVTCYYCSGKGELFDGVLCPNCHGEQEIRVTTVGFG